MKGLKDIDPVNFAFVMATAILSISLNIMNHFWLSELFFLLGTVGFVLLTFLFGLRLFLFPKEVLAEGARVEILFKYFTFSAGSSALAVRFCISDYTTIGITLGIIGAISAVILLYTTFCSLLFQKKVSIESVSPYWLLMAIACNYVGIVITTFWREGILDNALFLVAAFCFWTFGVTIYLLFMALNFYRMFFLRFEGKDINPSYWTCMGAAAIAVVDGCNWASAAHPPLFLDIVKPFVEGMNILLWGWATAWIPILCLMELWKYAHFKIAFQYSPALWAIVFPLGMYAAATDLLSKAIDLPSIQGMVPFILWAALLAWVGVSFLALLQLFKNLQTK